MDVGWGVDTGPQAAVISVSQNSFGRPPLSILGGLRDAGVQVRQTDLEGDTVIHFRLDDTR